MTDNFIQAYIDEVTEKGYEVSTDHEGNITVTDSNGGAITLRLIFSGEDTTLDLTGTQGLREDFEEEIKLIFEKVLNK